MAEAKKPSHATVPLMWRFGGFFLLDSHTFNKIMKHSWQLTLADLPSIWY